MNPEFVNSVKEILRIDGLLKNIRESSRHLEVEREHHRNILFEHIGSRPTPTKIQTPYGEIVIDERDRGVRFSIEDIRDILESVSSITESQREVVMGRFMEEEDSLKTRIRTLSVRRPNTRRKSRGTRRKTEKVSHLNQEVSLNPMDSFVSPDRTVTSSRETATLTE